MIEMKDPDIVIEQLKRHEGFRSKPYKCTADKTTIGYGRNLEDVGISTAEAEYLLLNDLEQAIKDAKALFCNFAELSENRQAVLVNMAFNLGRSRLKTFSNMRAAVEHKDFCRAADEMLDSLWAKQVKGRATELAALMRDG